MANEKGRHAAHAAGTSPKAKVSRRAAAGEGEGISTIRSGQGARVTTRKNAAEAADRARRNAEKRYFKRHPEAKASDVGPERSGKNVVLLVIASILVLAIVFVIGSCVTGLVFSSNGGSSDQPEQTLKLTEQEQQLVDQQLSHDVGQERADVGGSVSFGGDSYALSQQDDGTWALACTSSSGSSSTLFLIEGTPVALLRSSDTLLIPENRGEAWDVVCYVIDGHSGAGYVTTADGSLAGGAGEAVGAELDGTTLRVTDADGATHDVSLV